MLRGGFRWLQGAESYEELRRRMIDETNAFLTECVRNPELGVRIPVVPSGQSSFPRSFADAFWEAQFDEQG